MVNITMVTDTYDSCFIPTYENQPVRRWSYIKYIFYNVYTYDMKWPPVTLELQMKIDRSIYKCVSESHMFWTTTKQHDVITYIITIKDVLYSDVNTNLNCVIKYIGLNSIRTIGSTFFMIVSTHMVSQITMHLNTQR